MESPAAALREEENGATRTCCTGGTATGVDEGALVLMLDVLYVRGGTP